MTRNQNGRDDLRRRTSKKNKKLKRANMPPGEMNFEQKDAARERKRKRTTTLLATASSLRHAEF
jgi:hypothetical protein